MAGIDVNLFKPMSLIIQNISPIKIMKTLISPISTKMYLFETNQGNFISKSMQTLLWKKSLIFKYNASPFVAQHPLVAVIKLLRTKRHV